MENIFIEFLPPWVETGLQPAFYDKESGTILQQVSRMYAKMNEIIKNVNKQNESIIEYINKFIELQQYVDKYFDELNVQQEVNNKLDEMAESGELVEIIAQYLNLSSVLAFNTVDDMKSGENLIDGCFVQTFGFYNLNDGGEARYKIRTKDVSDTPDDQQIIELDDNTLVAELIKTEPLNVKQCGVHGDGTTDDTALIQNLIDTNGLKTLYFPYGTYLISEPLTIDSANNKTINLTLDENATIKTETSITSLLEIGANGTGAYDRYAEGSVMTIQGGIFDAAHTTQAIKILSNRKQTHFRDLTIINVGTYGIYSDTGNDSSSSTDNIFDNLSINGDKSSSNSVGLYLNANDDKLTHIRVNACKTAIYCGRSGHTMQDIHPLGVWSTQSPSSTEYENTKGIVFAGGGEYTITDLYLDTMGVGMQFANPNLQINISNLYYFWWLSNASYTTKLIDQTAVGFSRFHITNLDVVVPANGTFKGIDLSGTNINFRQYFPTFEQYSIVNATFQNRAKFAIDDYINCRAIYNDDPMHLNDAWSQSMEANKYYPIAYVKYGLATPRIEFGWDQIIDAVVDIRNTSISARNVANLANSGKYTLAICNRGTDADGLAYAYLCVKSTASDSAKNICISNTKGWDTQLFTYRGYNANALVNPTVNAEVSFNPI